MPRQIRILFTGLFISFLGSLPLGTINIAALQVSLSQGLGDAVLFIIGALLAEMFYVRLSLVAMDWIRKRAKLLKAFEAITFLIILALAAGSFYAAYKGSGNENPIFESHLHPFLFGLLMSTLNPMQIPFWFGWSTVLFSKKILLPIPALYNMYIIGIGIGTLAGNCVFIFGGRLLADSMLSNKSTLNWVIGSIFLLTALWQLYRMLKRKDPAHMAEDPSLLKEEIEEQYKGIDRTLNLSDKEGG